MADTVKSVHGISYRIKQARRGLILKAGPVCVMLIANVIKELCLLSVRFLQLLDFKSKQAFSFTHYLPSPFLLGCLVLYSEAILEKDASEAL